MVSLIGHLHNKARALLSSLHATRRALLFLRDGQCSVSFVIVDDELHVQHVGVELILSEVRSPFVEKISMGR